MSARASSLIDPALVERWEGNCRLAGCAPSDVDVYAIAAGIREWSQRTAGTARRVRNPAGLFVNKCKEAIANAREQKRLQREQLTRESARYGELYVQLFALIALRQPRPCDLAETLEVMRGIGYPEINPHAITRLRQLGATWPEEARPLAPRPEAVAEPAQHRQARP
jgi:hypothetical protein